MPQLSKYINLRDIQMTATTTDKLVCELDTANYQGALFLAMTNTTTGGLTTDLWLKHCASTTGTFVSLGSSNVQETTGGKGVLAADIYQPSKRWLQATLRTTSGNAHMSLLGFLYSGRKPPITWGATANINAVPVLCLVSPSSA